MQNIGMNQPEPALKTFAYSVKRYIGEYLFILNGVDFLVFTGGSGLNCPELRAEVIGNAQDLGFYLDEQKNAHCRSEAVISRPESPVTILVVPTNEEWIVASEIARVLENRGDCI